MWRVLTAAVLVLACGCSVTGRVRVNPPLQAGEHVTHKLPIIGPVTGEVEFKHEF